MRRGVVLAACLAVLSACGVETSGGSTPNGSKGDSSSGGGVVIDCTPGETFCQGETVWRCSYTGRDASQLMFCPAGNWHCVVDATNCKASTYPGNKACCL